MSQRASGYGRKPDEQYETIPWPVVAVPPHLGEIELAWDCCDRGSGRLVTTLQGQGIRAVGTKDDFLATTAPPAGTSHLITNPPYGDDRKGKLAERFIKHALALGVPTVAMLLRADFDSAITRQYLFRLNQMFAGKVVLLGRIKWFEGESSPSDNHAWFIWDREQAGPPTIRYTTRREAERRITARAALFADVPVTLLLSGAL